MKVQTFLGNLFVTLIVTAASERGSVFSRFCKNNLDCGEAFGYICGQNQTCHCDQLYTLNRYFDKCVGGVGQKCRYDEHCIEGGFCEFQKKCQCKEELYPTEDGLGCSKSRSVASAQAHVVLLEIALICLLKLEWSVEI